MLRNFKKLNDFDRVTKFRLINNFFGAMVGAMMMPLIITLKGPLLLPWVVGAFGILSTISVKSNNYITKKFDLDNIYKITVILDVFLLLFPLLYIYSPVISIIYVSVASIMETAMFSAYGILLNNYIADKYPGSMHEFQILRNSMWADGSLLGGFAISLILYCCSFGAGLILFSIITITSTIWLIYNWNFYKDIE